MTKRYPKQLSAGAHNAVIALSETEAAKIFKEDTRSEIGSEAEKMKFANAINSLIVGFLRLDFDEENNWEMLVMERIYALDFRSVEFFRRELMFSVFEDELAELHKNGFVHRDLSRPSDQKGDRFDNILLTEKGIRLIDVGISALRSQVGDRIFQKFLENELAELAKFKAYFLNR
jgi:serine/threonine protein kinase